MLREDDEAAQQSYQNFLDEDIDKILVGRTKDVVFTDTGYKTEAEIQAEESALDDSLAEGLRGVGSG